MRKRPLLARTGLATGALVALAAALGGCAPSARSGPEARADSSSASATLPVRAPDGRVVDALQGKPVVLVFFTSWCPVCSRELPVIQSVLRAAPDRASALGVALDEPDTFDQLDGFVARNALSFPVIRGAENQAFVQRFDADGSFPLVVVLDRKGNVAFSERGAQAQAADRLTAAIASAG